MPLSLDEIERRYLRYLLTTGKSKPTMTNYRRFFVNLRDYAEHNDLVIDAGHLDTELVREFHHWLVTSPLKQPYRGSLQRSPGGIFLQMELIKRLCAWLHEEGHLSQPVRVKLPKLPVRRRRALTAEELDRLMSCPYLDARHPQGLRNLALVSVMLDCGLRLAEVAHLTENDLYFDSGMLRVIGKGDKERFVPFSRATEDILRASLDERRAHPVLPPSPEAQAGIFQLSRNGIRELFRKFKVEANLPDLSPHVMRHTAATTMIANGMEPFTLKRILGHADIKTTEIYVHQDDRDLKAKHTAASPVANLQHSEQPRLPSRQAKIARARAKRITKPANVVPFSKAS